MTKEQILLALGNMLTADQINTDADDLYDASADRYKKYAKAKKVLNNPIPAAIVYPKNTEEVLRKYKKVVVAEQNMGQFAMYLRSKVEGVHFNQFNQVKGQPFVVNELVEAFTNLLKA